MNPTQILNLQGIEYIQKNRKINLSATGPNSRSAQLHSADAARAHGGGGAAWRPNGGTPPAHGRRPRKWAAHRRGDGGAARWRRASGEASGEHCRGGGARGEACGGGCEGLSSGGRGMVRTAFEPPRAHPESAAHGSQSRLGAARHCH
jgi:hypothetical protein